MISINFEPKFKMTNFTHIDSGTVIISRYRSKPENESIDTDWLIYGLCIYIHDDITMTVDNCGNKK